MTKAGPRPPLLSTLLSRTLVAFTIEFDNELERRLQEPSGLGFKEWNKSEHRIFLVSMPLWSNYLRFIPSEGVTQEDLAAASRDDRVDLILSGFKRWRYVEMKAGRVTPTEHLERARTLWEGLDEDIESRWRTRFGDGVIAALRSQLWQVVKKTDTRLPQHMPLARPQTRPMPFATHVSLPEDQAPDWDVDGSQLPLFELLSRALLSFTLEFEAQSDVALPVGQNTLRVLEGHAIPVSELALLSGISKEATAQVMTALGRNHWIDIEPIQNGRGKQVRLTDGGHKAKSRFEARIEATHADFERRFDTAVLTATLARLAEPPLATSGLAKGLVPPPTGWRALVTTSTLPDHPIVLGRGGWPDGS